MLVECPSCLTKFAIEANQIAQNKSAHFHCSRCDHYFEAKPLHVENKIKTDNADVAKKRNEKMQLSFIKKTEKLTLDFSNSVKKQAKKQVGKQWAVKKNDAAFQISLDLEKKGPQIIVGKKALTTICTLPICFTLFIGSLSWQVNNLPSIIQKSLLLNSSGIEQAPPDGIELSELNLQERPGVGVEIRGKIMNTSKSSFAETKIKTVFLDPNNAKLQEMLTTHDVLLEPNTKNNFIISLTELPKSSAWFSSRIYSVKRVPL